MQNILTVIGNPQTRDLRDKHEAHVRKTLLELGAAILKVEWLAPNLALDITFTGPTPVQVESYLNSYLNTTNVDMIAQHRNNRRKKLLIADMDSTIINVECIDELAALTNNREKIEELTARAMRGEIDFREALQERTRQLKGLAVSDLEEIYRSRIKLNSGARELVNTMRANGAFTALVSGGFTFFSERVAKEAGFHLHRANTLEVTQSKLTGQIKQPIHDGDSKLATLRQLIAEQSLKIEDTLAVGDGANDIPMLQHAGLGIAYHAKTKIVDAATSRIDSGDLTALLYIQGYREKDIIHEPDTYNA